MANHSPTQVPFGNCVPEAPQPLLIMLVYGCGNPSKGFSVALGKQQAARDVLYLFVSTPCDVMDSSDDDAPIGYTKMEAPSPSPSLPQPSSPPPQSSLTSPKPTATSSPNVNPQGSSGDPAAGKLSTAGRIKLSVAALITGRDDSVTPAPDHFTVLPGEAHAPFARDENFAVRRDAEQPVKHAIKHGLTDSERKWGREGLLGSKTKSVTAGGAAADAKRKLSAHLGMSARKGEEGEQQSCEYVAMNTPCESPVAEGNRVNHEVIPTSVMFSPYHHIGVVSYIRMCTSNLRCMCT